MFRQGKALVPSFSAFAVTQLLRTHFGDYVDVGFTAEMEEDLDQISNGDRDWLSFIQAFYRDGEGGHPGLEPMVARAEPNIEYPAIDIGADPGSNEPLRVRVGRYGPFVQRGDGGAGQHRDAAEDPRAGGPHRGEGARAAQGEGRRARGRSARIRRPACRSTCSTAGSATTSSWARRREKSKGKKPEMPKRASVPATITASAITLDEALQLLSLPRELGAHPGDGEIIVANRGRFGPYVKHGDEFRSLEDGDDVFTITLERALELLAAPKKSRRRTMTRTVLRSLGARPHGGAEVKLMDGRYGPYVTDGATNASLPQVGRPRRVHARGSRGAAEGARRGRAVEEARPRARGRQAPVGSESTRRPRKSGRL